MAVIIKASQHGSSRIDRWGEAGALACIHENVIVKWLQLCCWPESTVEKNIPVDYISTNNVCLSDITVLRIYCIYIQYKNIFTKSVTVPEMQIFVNIFKPVCIQNYSHQLLMCLETFFYPRFITVLWQRAVLTGSKSPFMLSVNMV